MKFVLSTVLVLSSLLFSYPDINEMASFKIEVKRGGDLVEMKCTQGCNWTELSFQLKKDKAMVVNELGAYGKSAYQGEPDVKFAFYVNGSPDGLNFESINGTKWKGLSYGRKPNRLMYLDETGVSSNKY